MRATVDAIASDSARRGAAADRHVHAVCAGQVRGWCEKTSRGERDCRATNVLPLIDVGTLYLSLYEPELAGLVEFSWVDPPRARARVVTSGIELIVTTTAAVADVARLYAAGGLASLDDGAGCTRSRAPQAGA